MAGSPQFIKVRGGGDADRTQDNIGSQLQPIATALAATPIMGAALPAWLAPDLKADFVNATGFATTGYQKDALGYTHGKGVVTTAAGVAAGTLVYTLPKGYRPKELHAFAVPNGAAATALLIGADGTVTTNGAVAAGKTIGLEFVFLADG